MNNFSCILHMRRKITKHQQKSILVSLEALKTVDLTQQKSKNSQSKTARVQY